MQNKKKLNIFFSIIFLVTLYFSLAVGNLFYDSTQSPDFGKYKNYISFYSSELEYTGLEQGNLYFFIVSKFIDIQSSNLNFYNYDEFISSRIQFANFIIFLISLFPLYKLLKKYDYEYSEIIYSFIFLLFFPPLFSSRLIFKPEIFIFCLFCWCIFLLEEYLTNFNVYNLLSFLILLGIITSTKLTSALMVLLFFTIFYLKKIYKHISRKFFLYVLFFVVIVLIFTFENYKFNSFYFFESQKTQIDAGYEDTANINFFFNFDLIKLYEKPFKHQHSDSFISILLLETFDDYFELYWNSDESSFSKDRNVFFTPYLKNYFGIINTTLFYFFIFYYIKNKKEHTKFLISPLIGILVMSLIAKFFIFNPDTGDMLKNYYYSFFLNLAFVFLVVNFIQKKVNIVKLIFLVIYVTSMLFIFGFPKSLSIENLDKINEQNKTSITCTLNSKIFKSVNSKCYSFEKDICKDYFNKTLKPNYVDGEIQYIQVIDNSSIEFNSSNSKSIVTNFESCDKTVKSGGIPKDIFKVSKYPIVHLFFVFLALFFYFSNLLFLNTVRNIN